MQAMSELGYVYMDNKCSSLLERLKKLLQAPTLVNQWKCNALTSISEMAGHPLG